MSDLTSIIAHRITTEIHTGLKPDGSPSPLHNAKGISFVHDEIMTTAGDKDVFDRVTEISIEVYKELLPGTRPFTAEPVTVKTWSRTPAVPVPRPGFEYVQLRKGNNRREIETHTEPGTKLVAIDFDGQEDVLILPLYYGACNLMPNAPPNAVIRLGDLPEGRFRIQNIVRVSDDVIRCIDTAILKFGANAPSSSVLGVRLVTEPRERWSR